MPVQVPFKRVIQTMIISLAVFVILLIYPLDLWSSYTYVGEIYPDSTRIVQSEVTISQTFAPETEGLSYIQFYIYNEDAYFPGGRLVFRLYDITGKLEEKEYDIEELTIPGLCRIRIGTEMDTENSYYFVIENPDAELLYAMEDGVNVDIQYVYREEHLSLQKVGRIALIVIIAAVLCLLSEFLLRGVQGSFRYDLGIRTAAGLVVSGISLWFLWNVFPAKRFTTDPLNIVVLEAGILLFAAYCLYGLFHKREKMQQDVIPWNAITAKLLGVIQTLAFAGVMTGAVNYLNALRLEEQKMGANLVYCSFAVAIICSFTKKELINWYNLVYAVIAVPAGIFYCLPYREDFWQWDIAKGNAMCVALWGIILCNIIRLLILERKPRYRISVIYTVSVILLLTGFIVNRGKRTWPIEAAVFFGLFALRMIFQGERTSYLRHFVNGIYLHFVGISIYAFLYRPFHSYTHVRYGGVFHTVTMAGVYDCLVLVLAAGIFLIKYARKKSLTYLWKEIGMIGLSAGFLFLTASKTGLYAAIALVLLILVGTAVTEYKERLVGLGKSVCILCLTAAAFIVIVFSACRLGPAVVSRPFTYDIEWFQDSVTAGEKWNSVRFITVQKFLTVFGARFTLYNYKEEAGAIPLQSDLSVVEVNSSEPQESVISSGNALTSDVEWMGGSLDYSNGRLDIFKLYWQELGFAGHETVELPEEIGISAGHAHNVYLQTAYDFGIITGIGFLALCIFMGIRSFIYYVKHREEEVSILPILLLGVYGICGMVEWVYLPCIPTGFAFFLVMAMMIPKEEKKQEG